MVKPVFESLYLYDLAWIFLQSGENRVQSSQAIANKLRSLAVLASTQKQVQVSSSFSQFKVKTDARKIFKFINMINVRESIILTSCFFLCKFREFQWSVVTNWLNIIYFVHHCRDVKICKETNRIFATLTESNFKSCHRIGKKISSCFAPLTVWHKVFPVFFTIRKKVRSPKKILR